MFNLNEIRSKGKFLGVKTTKNEENLDIYQYPPEIDTGFLNQFYIFYQDQNIPGYHINITFQNNCKWIKIGDIKVPKGSRRGYGSILLKEVENAAKSLGIERIWGNLDSEDDEHRAIQVSFYKKAGYQINQNTVFK
ncbi:GNAT family N-acetyltransferase [Fictibacillus barbaricus]|uniref:GNAT family N-acetyltransferase n=1 Tax=Fictibacillus barbaricus TaxID=182136 RepID=A0ABS2ZKZ6_9BACL|nr:GNAT family N-acetyltransferase [Fictibacillus barbaricus]MBN3547963.1 GNAT family N-acetyltransferase [Fictibacillus barbaricus]GGB52911.1 hypothetical protein GCM10007199_18480 [Fictibacillus barbaricus]